jgi:hypothetical protein
MRYLQVAMFIAAFASAALALKAGMIDISDNIDTFTQELAEQGWWVKMGAVANILATSLTGVILWLEWRKQR